MLRLLTTILLITSILSLSACRKCLVRYACCETGHAPWKSKELPNCYSEDTPQKEARMLADQHDDIEHGGVKTAQVCTVVKRVK